MYFDCFSSPQRSAVHAILLLSDHIQPIERDDKSHHGWMVTHPYNKEEHKEDIEDEVHLLTGRLSPWNTDFLVVTRSATKWQVYFLENRKRNVSVSTPLTDIYEWK